MGGFFFFFFVKKNKQAKPNQMISENVVRPRYITPKQQSPSRLLLLAAVRAGKSVLTVPGGIHSLVPRADLLFVH